MNRPGGAKGPPAGDKSPRRRRQSHREDAGAGPGKPPAPGANTYLYGIVRWPVPGGLKSLGTGVGDPPRPVRAVRHRDAAALVSDVSADEMSAEGARGLRRDMKAHSAFLNEAAGKLTVLPARFGVVLPDEQTLIAEVLGPQYGAIADQLDRLEGMVEVSLKATYVEDEILRAIVAEQPELAGSRGGRSASMAQGARLELGRRIAAAIQERQDQDGRWLIDALAPVVKDLRVGRALNDLMVLNASFLVERAGLARFDRALEQVTAQAGTQMRFDCVGPLPPFSFVNLRL